jgi:hypothetical protein
MTEREQPVGELAMDVTGLLIEAFQAAGADDGLVYVSVPITSGPRELQLLVKLGCTREQLRSEHRERWLAEVVRPNEREAVAYAARVRALFPQQLVVEPARLHVSQWSQKDYGTFWETLIRKFALRLIATPDWALSSGSRQEVEVAVEIGLPILDVRGHPQTSEDLVNADRSARDAARRFGFSDDETERYLPRLAFAVETSGAPALGTGKAALEETFVNRASSEVFSWLRGERALQLKEWGADIDDTHTREGLNEGSWWPSQLDHYLHRARELGIETAAGRQALAKFVATATALLESSVRIHGWLPASGVRLGENLEP